MPTRSLLPSVIGILLAAATVSRAADWTEFRGPGQQGHSDEQGLPLTWSAEEHVVWKTDIAGLGWSSPAIAGGKIWLTTGVDDGRSLRVLRLDAASGALDQSIEVFAPAEPGSVHTKNSHASPTPVIDGERVFVHFGSHGTACLSRDGEILWKTKLDYNHRHGPAGSPVVVGDLLVIACDGTDIQFVAALDKTTGKEVWRQPRGEGRMAYSTPTLAAVDGKPIVVSCGGEFVIAYTPESGVERWRFRYPGGYSNVPRPITGFGLTFVSSGYDTPVFYALPLDGTGELGDDRVAWKTSKGVPRNASPRLVGDELYMVSDNGVISCLDALATADGAIFLRTDTAIYRLDD